MFMESLGRNTMTKQAALELIKEARNPYQYSFEYNKERDKFLAKYKTAMKVLKYNEDEIDNNLYEFENCTSTREDLCDYYGGIDDNELDDAMEDDCKDYY